MRRLFLLLILGILAPAALVAETWTVELTNRQAKRLAELDGALANTAMAVSPDKAWGRGRGFTAEADAVAWALQNCRAHLKPGRRDCIVYAINGKRVAPEVVETFRVSEVYKPVSGRAAAAYHGLRPVDYVGRSDAALALLAVLDKDPARFSTLKRDPGLEQLLRGSSIAEDDRSGFAIWLGTDRVETWIPAKSGMLKIRWSDWLATPEGLVCLLDGRYLSDSGKRVGSNCLFLETIRQGRIQFRWLNSPRKSRKALLIAADARLGAAR